MLRPIDYSLDELKAAYAYHVYLHWQSYRDRAVPSLSALDRATLESLFAQYAIHLLDSEASPRGLRLLVSLRPDDAVTAAAGKLKGQTAKWLREQSGDRFARGYFACTSGKSTAAQVAAYLSSQRDHHGYADRARPPVFMKAYSPPGVDDARLQPANAKAFLRFHIVLSVRRRCGVFGSEARAIAP